MSKTFITREIFGNDIYFELTDAEIAMVIADNMPVPAVAENPLKNLAKEAFESAYHRNPSDDELEEAFDLLNDHWSNLHETASDILRDYMDVKKKYDITVTFTKTATYTATMQVEADDEDDAEEIAKQRLEDCEYEEYCGSSEYDCDSFPDDVEYSVDDMDISEVE